MKRQNLFVRMFFVLGLVLVLSGCKTVVGSGNVVREERMVDVFDSIDVRGQAELYITQGESKKITMEADDNILELIQTQVVDGTLCISQGDNYFDTNHPLKVYITTKNLNDISIKGYSKIISQNKLQLGDLRMDVKGSADIDLNIAANSIYTDISGSGDVKLTGSAKTHDILIKGSSNVDAQDLVTNKCDVNIKGSGECRVNVLDELSVKISGSGDVLYTGEPKILETKISGSGNVDEIRD